MTSPTGVPAWLADAACRDLDPQPFTDPHDDTDIEQAKTTCRTCPVQQRCRDVGVALDPRVDIGIWGGTTVAERRQIRRNGTPSPQPRRKADTSGTTQRPARAEGSQFIRTTGGDYTDTAGRTIITELPTGDWMTLVDDRPVARTDTVNQAKQTAVRILDDGDPKQPVSRTSDGDHVDAAGRTIITRLPTGDWMTLVDDRPVARTDTLERGQQAAWKTLVATSSLSAARNRSRTTPHR